jgi:hypothetical protein
VVNRLIEVEDLMAQLTDKRYVREWPWSQAADGYVSYDASTKKYFLSEEQSFAMSDEKSPAYLPGAFLIKSLPSRGA